MVHFRTLMAVIIALSLLTGIFAYQKLPDQVPSHWNAKGEVDGYSGKFIGAFLMPIIMVAIALLTLIIPYIDPLRKNIDRFKEDFNRFMFIVLLFFLYVHLLTIAWAFGYTFNMSALITVGVALLIYYSGTLLQRAKRNWFIGIRTPWTLSSDEVWDRTHRLGAKLFKGSALLMVPGVLMPDYFVYFVVCPILLSSFYLIVYSYLEYRKLNHK